MDLPTGELTVGGLSLAAALGMVWRAGRWLALKVITPLTAAVIGFIQQTQTNSKQNAETLKEMAKTQQQQTELLREIKDGQTAQTAMLRALKEE